jgi:hypothetical protein
MGLDRELGREDIDAIQDIKVERVDVPAWGGHVYVRVMTGRERDRFDSLMYDDKTGKARTDNLRALVAMFCLCDSKGVRLYGDDEVDKVAAKGAPGLTVVQDAAMRLNRLREQDVEGLAGNSPTGASVDSGSDSPAPSE